LISERGLQWPHIDNHESIAQNQIDTIMNQASGAIDQKIFPHPEDDGHQSLQQDRVPVFVPFSE
jgi:hypothetical protein